MVGGNNPPLLHFIVEVYRWVILKLDVLEIDVIEVHGEFLLA